MSDFFQKSMRDILDLAASAAPAPGGGSVAALLACLGLSMTAMVGNLTLGKKKYQAVQTEVRENITAATALSAELESLLQEDMDVFTKFIAALSLPQNTPEEQTNRARAREEALRLATETPLKIAGVCLEGLTLTARLAAIGNQSAISDAGVAALALEAALNGALLNVRANLGLLNDQAYITWAREESDTLQTRAAALKAAALQAACDRF